VPRYCSVKGVTINSSKVQCNIDKYIAINKGMAARMPTRPANNVSRVEVVGCIVELHHVGELYNLLAFPGACFATIFIASPLYIYYFLL